MAKRDVVLTYEDYAVLPADGRRYEIHDGELSVTPAPSPHHQMISRNLFIVLHQHVRTRGLGEVLYAPLDVILTESAIVQPDIVYLDRARLGAISRRGIDGLVDPEDRAIEALVLGPAGYSLAVRASGDEPLALPPFPDLALVPAALWP